jgi:hypothetical protein
VTTCCRCLERCIEFSLKSFQCNAIGWTFPSVLELERDRNQTAQDVQSPWSKKSWCEWRSFRSFSQMQFATCTCLFADVKILERSLFEIEQFPAVSVETVGHGMIHCVKLTLHTYAHAHTPICHPPLCRQFLGTPPWKTSCLGVPQLFVCRGGAGVACACVCRVGSWFACWLV